MKRSMRTMFVLLAIVLSLVAVQSVFAVTSTITGTIEAFSTQTNMIVVNEGTIEDLILTEVYGVKSSYYSSKCLITLNVGDTVSTGVYEFLSADGTTKLKACGELNVNDTATIKLRLCP